MVVADKLLNPNLECVVAIDGPAASGKGTIARQLAEKFSLRYCETGIFYRIIGGIVVSIGLCDLSEIINIAKNIPADFDKLRTFYDKYTKDCRIDLYSARVSEESSRLSAIADIRSALLPQQRSIAQKYKRVIMEGRDIGTVVLPDADLKIFLTCELEMRAQRRMIDMIKRGETGSLQQVQDDIVRRDNRDINRAYAPLKKAHDAYEIDSTHLTINDVCDRVLAIANTKSH